jgi:hypothetical protein
MPEVLTIVVIISSCVDVGNVKSVVNGDSVDSSLFVEDDDSSRLIDVEDASEKGDDVSMYVFVAIVDSRK